jgi:hypothetical protein
MALDLAGLVPVVRWHCGSCSFRDVTREAQPHSRFHDCAAFGGLSMPMLREGDDARVTIRRPEGYVGHEDVQLDGDGRPVMSAVTEYGDGHTDCAVFAPTAYLHGEAQGA